MSELCMLNSLFVCLLFIPDNLDKSKKSNLVASLNKAVEKAELIVNFSYQMCTILYIIKLPR